jgi:hypothetical protein
LLQLRAVESLIARLESSDERDGDIATPAPATVDVRPAQTTRSGESRSSEIHFVHRFDTDAQDLQRCGYVLELHERTGKFAVVAARLDQAVGPNDATGAVEARIDGWWAMQVLSGSMSPLAVLERRLSQPHSPLLESVRTIVGTGRLMRLNSRSGDAAPGHSLQRSSTPATIVQPSPKPEVDRQTLDRSPLRRAIGD